MYLDMLTEFLLGAAWRRSHPGDMGGHLLSREPSLLGLVFSFATVKLSQDPQFLVMLLPAPGPQPPLAAELGVVGRSGGCPGPSAFQRLAQNAPFV